MSKDAGGFKSVLGRDASGAIGRKYRVAQTKSASQLVAAPLARSTEPATSAWVFAGRESESVLDIVRHDGVVGGLFTIAFVNELKKNPTVSLESVARLINASFERDEYKQRCVVEASPSDRKKKPLQGG
jgi:hypothetical protein